MCISLKSIASVILFLVVLPVNSYAHGIKIFAVPEGDAVIGYTYYVGGKRLKNVDVIVLDNTGKKLGQVATDAEGLFVYKTDLVVAHRFVVKTAHGHRAEFTVPAKVPGPKEKLSSGLIDERNTSSENLHHFTKKELEEIVAHVVEHEVNLLREQLVIHEEKVRLRDIIGGIGYILGLAGLASLLQNRKKQKK